MLGRLNSKSNNSIEEIDASILNRTAGSIHSMYRTEIDDLGSSLVRVNQPKDTPSHNMTALSSTFQRATMVQSPSPKSAREGKGSNQKTRRQQEMQAALKYFKDEPIAAAAAPHKQATNTTNNTTTTAKGTPPSCTSLREEDKPTAEKKVIRRPMNCRCIVTGLFTCVCAYVCIHIYALYICIQICTYITAVLIKKHRHTT